MFLKNAWYAAIWSKDLTNTLVARRFLGENVVLARTAAGRAFALEDRCCHRAAPLSRGTLVGELVQCGYHGLKFDADGRCAAIPAQGHVPSGVAVRSYPLCERWNIVWIWMGEPAGADPSKIPDLQWLDDPAWATTPGYLKLEANYQLLIDNLLDLTHVSYLHRKTLAGDPREATTPQKAERLANGVRVGRWMIGFEPPPLFAAAGGFDGLVDRWQFATWNPPSTVYLDIGCATTGTGAPEGDRSQGISMWSNHLLTPETETSTHYLFCFARNFQLDNQEVSRLLYEGSRDTFLEDTEMLEAQQRNLHGGALDGLINISADAGQLHARHILDELIRAQP